MPCQKLKEFLDTNHVRYVSLQHSQAYTAQEIAAAAHIKGKEIAKSVVVKADGKMLMLVLPGSYKIDFEELKYAIGASNLRLANEFEFKDQFPGCDVGAMPPFGNLYGIPVFVAQSLAEDEEIAFNAGTHTELIKMSYAEYEKLANPIRLKFSFHSMV